MKKKDSRKTKLCTVRISDSELYCALFLTARPSIVKAVKPRLLLQLPRIYNLCFSWGGYHKLACGTKLGEIIVWDILDSLLNERPKVIVSIPNASLISIRSISWTTLLDGDVLVSSDSSGYLSVHDLKDPFMVYKMFRARSKYIWN